MVSEGRIQPDAISPKLFGQPRGIEMSDARPPILKHHFDIWQMAIREGLIALLPLTFLGALALVVAQPLPTGAPAWLHELLPEALRDQAERMVTITFGCMGLAGAMTIAMQGNSLLRPGDGSSAPSSPALGALAGVAFLLLVLPMKGASLEFLGYQNIFQGILAAILTVELAHQLHHRTKASDGLKGLANGTSMYRAIRLTWIAIAVLAVLGCLMLAIEMVSVPLSQTITHVVQTTLHTLEPGQLSLNMVLVTINQLLWMVGINGGQVILSWGNSPLLPIANGNEIWSNHAAAPMFLNAFAHLGGAGATWGLIVAILLKVEDKGLRRLALISIAPAILNVNELLLFGIPLIFSRVMIVPFLIAPLATAAIATVLVTNGGLAMNGSPVTWSTPIIVSGYVMTGSIWGAVLQFLCVFVAAAIYLPYVLKLQELRRAHVAEEFQQALDILTRPVHANASVLDRGDRIGDITRRMLIDFQHDLKTHGLRLAYQPQFDKHGILVGVEALLRWKHPVYGAIPPDAIVNVAEECDVIHDLGLWVTRQACADLCDWKRQGFVGFKVSINLSPVQLEHPDWFQSTQTILESFGIDPSEIDLEITDRRALKSGRISEDNLRKLKSYGYHISMDAFGMGTSSLLYMQRFKLRAIKLDKCLTQDIQTNPVNRDIIASVTRLARAQDVKTIAEFVETPEQRDVLVDLGCDLFQGWLYSRAVTAAELLEYIDKAAGQIYWPSLLTELIIDNQPPGYFQSTQSSHPAPLAFEGAT